MINFIENSNHIDYDREAAKFICEKSHIAFVQHFFKYRQASKFILNWHHEYFCDAIEEVFAGTIPNLVVNVPPGSTKTEIFVINCIARGIALNPWARFLHLSGSDSLAALNSATARDLVSSEEYQLNWPRQIAEDSKSRKRWNILVDGQKAGGVYATSIGGQVIGFRAGHMAPGFQGAIIIDDPNKPEDAFSPKKLNDANRKLLTVVNSRRANPRTPIILVQQRIAENDCTGFIEKGNLPGKWKIIKIPAIIDNNYVDGLKTKYRQKVDKSSNDGKGRFSYWPYKEPIKQLIAMEKGEGTDTEGSRISRHVHTSQYQQSPVALGGNIIKGAAFIRVTKIPKLKARIIYGDTAQKTKERNDRSALGEFGIGIDGRLYILMIHKGKWEAPELQTNALDFWNSAKSRDAKEFGFLRKFKVEDKVSGTGLIQTLKKTPYNLPIFGIERGIDKLTRVMDALPYIEAGDVCVPADAPWASEFISECEAFTADDSHQYDDQVDILVDAVMDFLGDKDNIEQWKKLGKKEERGGETR